MSGLIDHPAHGFQLHNSLHQEVFEEVVVAVATTLTVAEAASADSQQTWYWNWPPIVEEINWSCPLREYIHVWY